MPETVDKPPYVDAGGEVPYEDGYQVQDTPEAIAAMRASGLFAARVLDAAGALTLWDCLSGRPLSTLDVGGDATCVALSPDGRLLAKIFL